MDHSVFGVNELSGAGFVAALKDREAPQEAIDSAAELYAALEKYQVNPGVALAMAWREHQFWHTGVAVRTKGWANTKVGSSWNGRQIEGFRAYDTYTQALADYCELLTGPVYKGSGLLTVSQIIPRWAPASDGNDTAGYISDVDALVEQWQSEYGGGDEMIEVVLGQFDAHIDAQGDPANWVNIRSAPDDAAPDVGDVAQGRTVHCDAYTTGGGGWPDEQSTTWLRLASGLGWITGASGWTSYTLPQSADQLTATIRTLQQKLADSQKALSAANGHLADAEKQLSACSDAREADEARLAAIRKAGGW